SATNSTPARCTPLSAVPAAVAASERPRCDLAEVPRVTAHAMRGLLATITAERGMAGHLIAATLGHEDERTTMHAYAAPGSAAAGDRRRGLVVLNGGVQVAGKSAKLRGPTVSHPFRSVVARQAETAKGSRIAARPFGFSGGAKGDRTPDL